MTTITLVMGTKNWSSWSLRGWLALKATGVRFDEVLIPLRSPETRQRILVHSPAGRVPVLKYGDLVVWDSLAICEFLAERYPEAGLWPDGREARAHARSVAAEMHAGFAALRDDMPMDCRARKPGEGRGAEALADIARVMEIWRACRQRFGAGGDYLFGAFSAADAMYAPVVSRFVTYDVPLDEVTGAYVEAVRSWPAMKEWLAAAERGP